MNLEHASRSKKLILSLIFDAIGLISLIVPPFDFIWAPASGYLMTRLYKGRIGKIAGVVAFVEEALPGFDIIPSFTLMWVYTHFIKEQSTAIDQNKQ